VFILRFLIKTIAVVAAALAGNWFGEQVRSWGTGEPARELRYFYTNEEGEIVVTLSPRLSNFIPAVLAGVVARPSWFWAFIAGVFASAVLGDRYEQFITDLLTRGLSNDSQSPSD
jgi:hypothetical protein